MLREVFTGRMRPRHHRFRTALAELLGQRNVSVDTLPERVTLPRISTNLSSRLAGVRVLASTETDPLLVHQALAMGPSAYASEFDVPMALYGYARAGRERGRWLAQRLLDAPALRGLFVFSDWAKRSFDLHFGPSVSQRCHVLYPLASMEPEATEETEERRYDLVFVSTQFRIKSGPELAHAFRRVRTKYPTATLAMVTALEEAKALLGPLDRFEGIEWIEANLPPAKIGALLRQAKALVHPSLLDSFGVVVLEAMAAGCALVTTDVASFPELTESGFNGWLVPAPVSAIARDEVVHELTDPEVFAKYLSTLHLEGFSQRLEEVLLRLFADPAGWERMRANTRRRYQERFSQQAWNRSMRAALQEMFPAQAPLWFE